MDRALEALLEGVAGLPAELVVDLRRVDRVATIVSGSIRDEGLEIGIARKAACLHPRVLTGGPRLFEQGDDVVDQLEVRALRVAADVVLLSLPASLECAEDTVAVIFDK